MLYIKIIEQFNNHFVFFFVCFCARRLVCLRLYLHLYAYIYRQFRSETEKKWEPKFSKEGVYKIGSQIMTNTSRREDSKNNKDVQPVPLSFPLLQTNSWLFLLLSSSSSSSSFFFILLHSSSSSLPLTFFFLSIFSVYSQSQVRSAIFISCLCCN